MSDTELAKRLTVTEVVRVYEEATARIRGAFALVSEAEKLLNDTFTMGGNGSIHVAGYHGRVSFDDPERHLLEIRHRVWDAIVDRLEVRRMMSVERAKELDKQIKDHELPEITHESVAQLVQGLHAALPKMLEEAVEEVFNWLRPHHSKYQRNSEYEVPPKIVLEYVVERWGRFHNRWSVNYRREPELTALENVFSALAGQGQITKTHYSAISTAIRAKDFDGKGETPYFKFTVYKNGNAHIEFKRLDLLARFNQIAGGKRLRKAPESAAAE